MKKMIALFTAAALSATVLAAQSDKKAVKKPAAEKTQASHQTKQASEPVSNGTATDNTAAPAAASAVK